MVHDDKVTVPLLMITPPPCKHKRYTCENPIGAMGSLQAWLSTHISLIHPKIDRIGQLRVDLGM
jgi:hypothetical protein